MSKVIVWTGSISYNVGSLALVYGQEITLTEEELKLLPSGSYKVIKTIKNEPDEDKSSSKEVNAFTVAQLKEIAEKNGIEIPSYLTKKADIYQFIKDQDVEVV
jgi:hypothetical protein